MATELDPEEIETLTKDFKRFMEMIPEDWKSEWETYTLQFLPAHERIRAIKERLGYPQQSRD